MEPSPRESDQLRKGEMKLPIELILHIMSFLTPSHRRAIFPTFHTSAKTLLSLSRVSKATYGEATKLFRQHYMFVSTRRRLADMVLCMQIQKSMPTRPYATGDFRTMSSLYLAPFTHSDDDFPVALWACDLLLEVAWTLKRLVVKMPISSLPPPDHSRSVQRGMRQGLESLRRLEEFVCLDGYPVGDESGSGYHYDIVTGAKPDLGDVCEYWPLLKRLALFGVALDRRSLWQQLARLGAVEEVILARAEHLDVVNIKEEYFAALDEAEVRQRRQVRVMLMDVAYDVRDVKTDRWAEIDRNNRVTVEVYEVPTSFYGDESAEEAVAAWLKMGALDGRLWDWRGGLVR